MALPTLEEQIEEALENQPEATHCRDCGRKLQLYEIDANKDVCFDCYYEVED